MSSMNRRQFLKGVVAVPVTVGMGMSIETGLTDGWLGHPPLQEWQRVLWDAISTGRGTVHVGMGRQMGKHYIRQQHIRWSKVADPTSWPA